MKSLARGRPRKTLLPSCGRCVIRSGLRGAGVEEPAIDEVCDRLQLRSVRRRQILFVEGGRGGHLYSLRTTRVKLAKLDGAGREHIVAILGPCALLGVESVFGRGYAGTAEVLSEGELCVGPASALDDVMASVPGFGVSLAGYVHEQLESAWAHQACLGTVGARARLSAYLLQQLGGDGSADGNGNGNAPDTVQNPLTQTELGAILGISAETVCRVLSAFRAEGLVETAPDTIRVLDRTGLEQVAQG